jgi:hypothetical protein
MTEMGPVTLHLVINHVTHYKYVPKTTSASMTKCTVILKANIHYEPLTRGSYCLESLGNAVKFIQRIRARK